MAPDVWEADQTHQAMEQQWRQLDQAESLTFLHTQGQLHPPLQRHSSAPGDPAEKHHKARRIQYLQHQQQQPALQSQQQRGLTAASAAVLLLYMLLVSAGMQHLTSGSSSSSSSRRSLAAGPIAPAVTDCNSDSSITKETGKCAFGSLPGTWVGSAPAGARWQLLDESCKLTNWLAAYTAAEHSSSSGDSSSSSSSASGSTSAGGSISESVDPTDAAAHDPAVVAAAAAAAIASGDSTGSSTGTDSSSSSSSSGGAAAGQQLPEARILLLSDSVDRFIVQHVCNHLGGTKHTLTMHRPPSHATAEAAAAAAGPSSTQAAGAAGGSAGGPAPSSLNKTAYAFHTCESRLPLKLASSYFPGVHPSGPFHRGLAQDFRQRIDAARAMWERYAGPGNPPHLVSVAALLWDVARMYLHERQRVEGRDELELATLRGWMANFTAVVQYAQQTFPEAKVWVTHTTMPPRFSAATGLMAKPYLGRRYFVDQLNAAASAAAPRLGLQLVDYAALAGRFVAGQSYLADLIHPNALVGVEVFNVLLNLALQQQQGQGPAVEATEGGVGAGG